MQKMPRRKSTGKQAVLQTDRVLNKLIERINSFRDAREWAQFHSLKNLIISMNLEASEVLELCQWKQDNELDKMIGEPEFNSLLAEECADVFIYLLLICDKAGIDLVREAFAKLDKNEVRYPVSKARGNAGKYTSL